MQSRHWDVPAGSQCLPTGQLHPASGSPPVEVPTLLEPVVEVEVEVDVALSPVPLALVEFPLPVAAPEVLDPVVVVVDGVSPPLQARTTGRKTKPATARRMRPAGVVLLTPMRLSRRNACGQGARREATEETAVAAFDKTPGVWRRTEFFAQ